MHGDRFYLDGRLYRFNYAGDGPPWRQEVWNADTSTWDQISGPGVASSLLVLTPSTTEVLTDDWLEVGNNEAVLTTDGAGITCGTMYTASIPDFVTTAQGDVIGVLGL